MATAAPPPPYFNHSSTSEMDDILQQFRQQNESDQFSFMNSRSNSFTFGNSNDCQQDQSIPSDLLTYLGGDSSGGGALTIGSDDQLGGGGIGGNGYSSHERNYSLETSSLQSFGGGYNLSPTVGGSSSSTGSAFSAASSPSSYQAQSSSSATAYVPSPSFDSSSLSPQSFFSYSNNDNPAPNPMASYRGSPSGGQSTQYSNNNNARLGSASASPPHISNNYSTQQGSGASSSGGSVSSPNDSLSPYTPPANSNGFVPNEALVRMLATAQAQGQLQAQAQVQNQAAHAMAQAAYNQSYLATLNMMPLANQNGVYQAPSTFYGLSSSQPESCLEDFSRGVYEGEQKKRRVSDQEYEQPSVNIARSGGAARGSPPSGTRTHRTTGSNGGRRASPPPHGIRRSEAPPALNFSLKREAVGADVPRSSVEVIANAGITLAPDARKVYRDDLSPKFPMPRRGSNLPPATPTVVSTEKVGKAPTAAEKKADKAAGKKATTSTTTEKRKKGDKGHNAVERRYRNNINNAIATLRDIVPALRHLKPLPSMPASRRRASQFTLSTAAQAPTPAGLIDGIPAAKTLSKGSILSTSIAYIQYLQGARADSAEDIEIFKAVVMEMVAGGPALIEAYEARRAVREAEREKTREAIRKEQAALDDEDENSDDEEDEAAPKSSNVKHEEASDPEMEDVQPTRSSPSGSSQGAELNHPFPPSPVSGSEDSSNGISPRVFTLPPNQRQAPTRMFLGAFMGLSFAGGLGYDYLGGASEAATVIGARAWAGRIVRRATPVKPLVGPSPVAVLASDLVHPGVLTGVIFIGLATIIVTMIYILSPLFTSSPEPASTTPDETEELIVKELPRSIFRQQRRADALASLADLSDATPHTPSYAEECKAALKARRELLRLVGAPTYGLLPALAKEALALGLRNITTIRVGSFSTWSESDRLEAAVAWVRIAEIEAALGGAEINPLARWYTFLRLFNLSRSPHWPQTTSSTTRTNVNAVLALHLDSLNHPLYANALWNQAIKADRKKCDTVLDPWTEIAINTDLEQVRLILTTTKKATDWPSPSDTVPLLRVSEARCEAALRETWAKIFVAVVQTQTVISGSARFATIVDQPRLEETIAHVIASTSDGSPVHSMAKVTRALCAFYIHGRRAAAELAEELANEARRNGAVSRLGCASAFFALLLDEDAPHFDECQVPSMEVDILASATIGWLTVHQDSEALMSAAAKKAQPPTTPSQETLPESPLPSASSSATGGRRAIGSKVFTDPSLIAFCASPVADALKFLRAAGLDSR